jgi:hypothetical protein
MATGGNDDAIGDLESAWFASPFPFSQASDVLPSVGYFVDSHIPFPQLDTPLTDQLTTQPLIEPSRRRVFRQHPQHERIASLRFAVCGHRRYQPSVSPDRSTGLSGSDELY